MCNQQNKWIKSLLDDRTCHKHKYHKKAIVFSEPGVVVSKHRTFMLNPSEEQSINIKLSVPDTTVMFFSFKDHSKRHWWKVTRVIWKCTTVGLSNNNPKAIIRLLHLTPLKIKTMHIDVSSRNVFFLCHIPAY